jgi:hypothetical protein
MNCMVTHDFPAPPGPTTTCENLRYVRQKVHTAAAYNAARIRHQVRKAQQSSDQHFKAEPKVHAETTCSNAPAPRPKSGLQAAAATAPSTEYGTVRYTVRRGTAAASAAALHALGCRGGIRGRRFADLLPKTSRETQKVTRLQTENPTRGVSQEWDLKFNRNRV